MALLVGTSLFEDLPRRKLCDVTRHGQATLQLEGSRAGEVVGVECLTKTFNSKAMTEVGKETGMWKSWMFSFVGGW